jgi:hypothetical protein
MTPGVELFSVRCASCHRAIAVTYKEFALRNSVYCDDWCYAEYPISPMQERNDMWRLLVALGESPVAVAKAYDVSHSLVYKTLAK